ncbi:tail fiber protein [Winogradskyella sp.]|nr:tail fiber protein [Winogradskyella sp.]MDA8874541.1 tail fiber protein [Winogradskyella sp.]
MFKKVVLVMFVIICLGFTKDDSKPMSQDGFVGEVKMFAGNFAPRGWALCEVQLLAVSSNPALFSILGTTYGDDGRTTFALPDMRGRVPVGQGNGPGLSDKRLGQLGGSETTTSNVVNVPSMYYQVPGFKIDLDKVEDGDITYGNQSFLTVGNSPNTTINTQRSGGNQAINNMQPYTGINYIICLYGTYPSRS